jgi:hypothetical protein
LSPEDEQLSAETADDREYQPEGRADQPTAGGAEPREIRPESMCPATGILAGVAHGGSSVDGLEHLAQLVSVPAFSRETSVPAGQAEVVAPHCLTITRRPPEAFGWPSLPVGPDEPAA